MTRRVELYGRLRDAGLGSHVDVALPSRATARQALAALKAALGRRGALLAGCALATDDAVLGSSDVIPRGGRLAALPRMRRIGRSKLNPAALAAAVSSPKHGAVSTFVGVVRAVHAGRRVRGIEYDSFIPLAEKELARILAEAERKWPAKVEAAHRIGALRVGEASVAVAAGSMHRPEAFAACRWTIDEIKTRLPVWKKEKYVKGEGRWLPGCALHGRKS